MLQLLLHLYHQQDQYIFIHDAILESVTCGDTQIDAGNLRTSMSKLLKKSHSGMTELELQFAVSTFILQINSVHQDYNNLMTNINYTRKVWCLFQFDNLAND